MIGCFAGVVPTYVRAQVAQATQDSVDWTSDPSNADVFVAGDHKHRFAVWTLDKPFRLMLKPPAKAQDRADWVVSTVKAVIR